MEIGAMTSVSDLLALPTRSALTDAAATIGGPAMRNMATIGGNLFAPAPAGDLGVALLALDAEVEVAQPDGRRWQSLETFFAERGDATFSPRAIVTRVRIPPLAGRSLYRKLGRRQGNSPAVVALAIRIERDADGVCRDARLALGAAGPALMRAKQAEQELIGQRLDDDVLARAAGAAMAASHPMTDALASDWYRQRMVGVVVRQMLETMIAA
jgi:CO/xanthine dehydrogenase FAD-binding subunit